MKRLLGLDPVGPTPRLLSLMGLRCTVNVIALNPSRVRGSHGRLPDDRRDAPVLLVSDPRTGARARDDVAATGGRRPAPRTGRTTGLTKDRPPFGHGTGIPLMLTRYAADNAPP
ncbi:hypothetical protein [Streptomyces turgidiscabies]|uniref:Transposase n=1 Tax=Streptomyces turgidiscabies TaxID=85558 RepID=A0ABU0S028_9ACTN|nr:hypothetical protein [Streptomyces turgidiscabies]MDQ0937565.1 hypothetical protein [Streptomyces turgidiscabies]